MSVRSDVRTVTAPPLIPSATCNARIDDGTTSRANGDGAVSPVGVQPDVGDPVPSQTGCCRRTSVDTGLDPHHRGYDDTYGVGSPAIASRSPFEEAQHDPVLVVAVD